MTRAGHGVSAVAVYCASSPGRDGRHARLAARVGTLLAEQGVRVVYGGGTVGLMGVLADAALAAGGEVVGVIPRGLFAREVAHGGLTELVEVDSMHERKAELFGRADAFVALPGGWGTLDELAEVVTWSQLGMHDKPIALLDDDGYWDPLVAFVDGAVAQGFMRPENAALLTRVRDPDGLLPALAAYTKAPTARWLEPDET